MSIMKQDQRRLDNLAKAYHRTSGAIQKLWKKKWYELIKIDKPARKLASTLPSSLNSSLIYSLASITALSEYFSRVSIIAL